MAPTESTWTDQEFKDDSPDAITPVAPRRKTLTERGRSIKKAFTTKEGLIGSYDYAFLFKPNIPFITKPTRRAAPFFGVNERMPVLLSLLLGFQHALAMLAGVITPPIILASAANLEANDRAYLVSTSMIVCGLLSAIQITRFHIWRTPYYVGTGLISVVGTSFATIPAAQGGLTQMYATGYCPTDDEGNRLPCPDGYGAILGTAALCALIEIALAFIPPRMLQKAFPAIVTGPTVMLIGVKLIASGFTNWAGGSNCASRPTTGLFQLCPDINAPRPLPWGSPEFIGLGFLVFVSILLCERFGSPIMKSCAVALGLLVGCIVAGATGYFDRSGIDSAPVASFIWTTTFRLRIYPPLILPFLAVYVVLAMEAIGDITATCEVSKLSVRGRIYESRIQGGVLADGLNGMMAALCTLTPMSTFAQNNGVIAMTRCANRKAGYACCFWLVVMGIFAKFAAALVAISSSVLGGMTTFLFAAVVVSALKIISTQLGGRGGGGRKARVVLTAALALGYGATLVPSWFTYVFTYSGDNDALTSLIAAVELVMASGFTVCGFVALILNLLLQEEVEDEVLEGQNEQAEPKSGSDAGSEGDAERIAVGPVKVGPGDAR